MFHDLLEDSPNSGKKHRYKKYSFSYSSSNSNGFEVRLVEMSSYSVIFQKIFIRNLSNRVMAEFAALYSDSSDDTDTTSAMIKPQMKLKFDN